MDSIRIQGGIALQGKVRIQGSKNASLPVLAATLLVGEESLIRNCPRIADVHSMARLLECLGCRVRWNKSGIFVDSSKVKKGEMPREAVTGMRSSLCLLGALIGRCGEVTMEYPGGCVIGARPIDMHLSALRQMGVVFKEEAGQLHAEADFLHGAHIVLPFPSVGATENVILAAVAAEGVTVLEGAAREPEICALCNYLSCCGACIEGAGSSRIVICGGKRLCGSYFCIPADRIVAGTYLLGCIGVGGTVFLEHAPAEEMEAVILTAEQMGGHICTSREGIYVQAPRRPLPVKLVTAPYPGFPTDLQSVALVAAVRGIGCTSIEETIFENRFRIVDELKKMGARVEVTGCGRAVAQGVEALQGARLEARELRGGAALVVAGLMAEGVSFLGGCSYIERGYENICRDFRELGARVTSV